MKSFFKIILLLSFFLQNTIAEAGNCIPPGTTVTLTRQSEVDSFPINYPDCDVTYSFPKGSNFLKKRCEKCNLPIISFGKPRQHACLDPNCGKENIKRHEPKVVGKCPECGNDLLKRSGRYGDFVGCKGFPKCRYTSSLEELKSLNNEN